MIAKLLRSFIFILICLLLSSEGGLSQSKQKFWVYFNDKPGAVTDFTNQGQDSTPFVSLRAVKRRAKVLPAGRLADEADLPPNEKYIEQIENLGGTLAVQSRWFNAASFYLDVSQAESVTLLPFVNLVKPVATIRGFPFTKESAGHGNNFQKADMLDYGPSYAQSSMINVPGLHNIGVTGKNILVGILDSGFRWKNHEAFQRANIIKEHDFVFNDDVTENQPQDVLGQDSHGTAVLSVAGGYRPGELIGVAFDADFILGKTEYIATEYMVEEDNWVAAVEWMEGYGVDVISSSVAYNLFDDGSGYFWENGDFNGRTSVTARAAVRAARLGVLVCSTMGNEGNGNGIEGTMLTPADADSIISVGAATLQNRLAYFSSTGPTNDGRIKPDVVAPGVSIRHAAVPGPDTYGYSEGTSMATPLTAGSAALILSARPELTPVQIRDAIRETAAPSDTALHRTVPNNFTGWGLVNALGASLSFGPVFSNQPKITRENGSDIISTIVVSKFGIVPSEMVLYYSSGVSQRFSPLSMTLDSSAMFPTSGRYCVTPPPQSRGTPVRFYMEAGDSASNYYRSPASAFGGVWSYYYGDSTVGNPGARPNKIYLHQNYPNPFSSETWIEYDLPERGRVTMKVYDLLGQSVGVLVNEVQEAGNAKSRPPVAFDPRGLASGIYILRLTTPDHSSSIKMMLIR